MGREHRLSRRQFGGLLAAAPLAAVSYSSVRPAAQSGQPAKKIGPIKAHPFPLKQVRLLSGSCYTLQDRNRVYLHTLDSDRLLHTFRLTAGLPSTAEQLGGWERPDIELRGHFMGHYLSACGLMVSSTGDDLLKSKADAIVAELGKCQRTNGNGWLSAFPAELMQRLKPFVGSAEPSLRAALRRVLAGKTGMRTSGGVVAPKRRHVAPDCRSR